VDPFFSYSARGPGVKKKKVLKRSPESISGGWKVEGIRREGSGHVHEGGVGVKIPEKGRLFFSTERGKRATKKGRI